MEQQKISELLRNLLIEPSFLKLLLLFKNHIYANLIKSSIINKLASFIKYCSWRFVVKLYDH